tara:strand:- start:106749 stop:107687 length:939 start_codon:yes stop_codon:yes gene_type:complete
MSEKIQLAVTPWSSTVGWSASALCEQAETAEAMGFHSFWLPENHFGDHRSIPSPLTLLAAVASRTTRIRLGSTSYLLPIRHPLQAAEEVAVLDQLSSGRVILGVGRGMQPEVFEAFSVSARDKRKIFQARLEVMLAAWRGEPVLHSEQGAPVLLAPLPVQRPHPPVWVAAFGPLALKQVASLGLPYLASPIETLAVLEANYNSFHAAVKELGHPQVSTIPVMRTVFVTPNDTQAKTLRRQIEQALPSKMRKQGVAVEDWGIVGDRAYCRDKLLEYVERLNISHLIVRGGARGLDEAEQLRSHEALLALVATL